MAACAAAFSLTLAFTGGFRVDVLGVRVSSRGPFRSTMLALVSGAAWFLLLGRSRQDALVAAGSRLAHRSLPAIALASAVVVLALGFARGSRAAGGSDAYGYISQALLWRQGSLLVPQPFAADVPWPNADWTFTPLGYTPAADHALVPTYSPGLPLIMALFGLALGACGPYLVGPVCGAAMVGVTYLLGARLSGRAVGVMAALGVATSPTFLHMMLWPMSDVPVALCWSAALLLATFPRSSAALGSGVTTGLAILVRPNLAPLALFPAAMVAWRAIDTDWRGRVRRVAAFAMGCVPFALLVGWTYNELYGSPLRSGYGDASTLFATEHLRTNLAQYPRWFWDTQGPFPFLFLLAVPLSWRWRRAGTSAGPSEGAGAAVRLAYLAFIAGVLTCYLWYTPFEEWWFLRFLLPAFPLIFALAADAVWTGSGRLGPRARAVSTVLFTGLMLNHAAAVNADRRVLDVGRDEQKYPDVGRYVDAALPSGAIVFAMQHSGSVRFYSGRTTLRYDMLQPDWFDRAIAHFARQGQPSYAVLDDWELPIVRSVFAGQANAASFDRPPMAEYRDGRVLLYRLGEHPSTAGFPAPIPPTSGCECNRCGAPPPAPGPAGR